MAPKQKEEQHMDSTKKDDASADVPQWHAMTLEECYSKIGVNSNIRQEGLSTSDAAARLEKYGYNKLSEGTKKTLFQKIWAQIANVLVAILIVVAIVSLVKAFTTTSTEDRITYIIEVVLIVFVVVLNCVIGIVQEGSAEKAAEALKNMLSSDAVVIRDGKQAKVPAGELVPGDVVLLGLGDKIPGDIRMIECNNIATLEAALTGESVPIEKQSDPIKKDGVDPRRIPLGDRKNMAFSATLVAQGAGVGLVVATGDHTEIGTINALVSQVEDKKTAVLQQIDFVSTCVAVFVMITAFVTWMVYYFMIERNGLDALSTALVCAVAMIPEGLASIVTMTYSWAVATMAKNNAIVRKLPAVETLGSVTVICSDKTGTLTKNEMSLVAYVTSNAHYKFDVDSKERRIHNFVRDDSYLAERASTSVGQKAKTVIREGPSAHREGKGGFGFSMHGLSGHSTGSGIGDVDEEEISPPYDPTPVQNGEFPSESFIRGGLAVGTLCSKCSLGKDGGKDGEIGNPTEISILRAAYFCGIDVELMKKQSPIIAEIPFSSEYKFMATIHEPCKDNDGIAYDGKYVAYVKGAPDRMIKYCKYQARAGMLGEEYKEPIDTAHWIEQIAVLSSHGLRCLALCRGAVDQDKVRPGLNVKPELVNGGEPWLTIYGLCAIMDPPRPECVDAIKIAHRAGVRVVMITGDHKDTALAIGDQLGLVDAKYCEAITGPELDDMTDDELRVAVMKYNIFARASPQNKIQIVKALQAEGEICSMTGDGVNDAPALKAADMGVAMGKEGTDVAREASEMILADDNFATIVVAVREGRAVWDNLRKVLFINQPINNAQGMTILFGIITGLTNIPLTAIQVLYCNLVCAVTLGFIAAVEPAEEGIMDKAPRAIGKRIIGRYLLLRMLVATIVMVATTVGSVWLVQDEYSTYIEHSVALNTLSFNAIALALSARFEYSASFHPRVFRGNPICWYMVATMVILQVFITYTPGLNSTIFNMGPMDAKTWGFVIAFMSCTFLTLETEKATRRYLKGRGVDTSELLPDPGFDIPQPKRSYTDK